MRKGKWKLVHQKSGEEVMTGETITSFRDEEYTLIDGSPPHKPSSTGKVYVSGGWAYYPSVFDLEWRKYE